MLKSAVFAQKLAIFLPFFNMGLAASFFNRFSIVFLQSVEEELILQAGEGLSMQLQIYPSKKMVKLLFCRVDKEEKKNSEMNFEIIYCFWLN